MMARQTGKNQLSAVLEAYLLMAKTQGTIVKAAPTFTPQIITSRLRLLSLFDTPLTRERIWTSHGYIIGLAPRGDPVLLRNHAGPRIMFYSAGPQSNVVGATADLLLEIDEAQDVTPEKFDRDFRPMAAVANATTLPILLLGGESAGDAAPFLRELSAGMSAGPNVRGALVGRNVLYPGAGDPLAVAEAAGGIVHNSWTVDDGLTHIETSGGRDINTLRRYLKQL